jgi:G3E family GTPase
VTAPLPAIVVGGYLGAGKTTLLNHLLRHAGGRRIAVLVNDFGDLGIDADLIESRDGDVLNLAGGCVCCSVGSDLMGALLALPLRPSPPDLVLIETSGVALPGSVARSVRLAEGIEVDGVVVLADAETIRGRAQDPYVGDTVLQQLHDADLLLLNKIDLVASEALAALRAWLDTAAPRARRIETIESRVAPQVVLGLADADAPPAGARGTGLLTGLPDGGAAPVRPAPAAADLFESASFRLDAPVDARALAARLAEPGLALVRAKGIVVDLDGAAVVVQAVGCRARVAPAGTAHDGTPGRLVVIGLRGRLDTQAVRTAIAASVAGAA